MGKAKKIHSIPLQLNPQKDIRLPDVCTHTTHGWDFWRGLPSGSPTLSSELAALPNGCQVDPTALVIKS